MIGLAVLIAFACLFINATTWEGMIFEDVANYLDTKLPEWISKPLYGCPICLSFWYGSLFYIIYEGVKIEMLIVVFAAAGMNAAIINMNNHIKDDQ